MIVAEARSRVVSSFTIIKGSMIDETHTAFRDWDFALSKRENLRQLRDSNSIGATSTHWLRDVSKVFNRRFDPATRDRPLVDLAKSDCDRAIWNPLLLWHMTRDEFLLRDFLVNWLYGQFSAGAFRLHTDEVQDYLKALKKKKGVEWSGGWTRATSSRVASGLLRIAADFGLLTGKIHREFTSYHLPDESFLYLLHAMSAQAPNARAVIESEDWHMYLMDSSDVERELLRLHQFKKLHYEAAGSLVRLSLPCSSIEDYAKGLCR